MSKKRKKLIFVLPEYDKNTSTHFTHTLDLIDEAGKHLDIMLFIEYAKGCPKLENVKKVYCQKFTFPLLSFLERFLFFMALRLDGYKNFYVHYSYWSAILAKLAFARIFYWHCEAYANYGADRKKSDLKWKFFDDIPMRICFKICKFLVTGTESVADFYVKVFKIPRKKIKVMPNSINLDELKPASKKVPGQIVFVHWLAPRKGADLLPNIVRDCLKERGDLKFLIVGEGPLEEELKEEFKDISQVEMLGVLPNKRVRELIAESELMIMPSRQEGFPRVIIEAMALGTAFVSTDVGGVKDIASEGAQLIEPEDTYEFAKATLKIISDSTLRENLVKSGLHKVKDFSHDKVAKLFEAII